MYIGSSSFLRTDLRILAAALLAVATVVGVDSQYFHTGLTEVLDTWLRIQYQSVIGLCVAPPLPKNIKHIAILLIILALACVAAVKLQVGWGSFVEACGNPCIHCPANYAEVYLLFDYIFAASCARDTGCVGDLSDIPRCQ